MKSLSRRSFLQTASLAAAGAALSARSRGQVSGANSDVRVGMIGLGSRSKQHLRAYDSLPGVRVVAVCDADSERVRAAVQARRARGQEVQAFADFRQLLDRPDIDAVSIASPNHWHSLMAIWACQAGKDVYVEKPVSHNIWEGRQEVAAAASYGRIVQAGTQSRSRQDLIDSVAWIRAGNLGRIKVVRGLCYKRRPSIGLTRGPQPIPASVNFDLWTGPAPLAPLRRKHLHYDWHWVWPTGCGDLGNQGIHQMDVARWYLGDPHLAPHSLAVGGRLGYVDDGETPNTVAAIHNYAEAPLIFEVRGLPIHTGSEAMGRYPDPALGTNVGVVVHCEGGFLVAANGPRFDSGAVKTGTDYGMVAAFDLQNKCVKRFEGRPEAAVESDHFGNFLAAVRSRQAEKLRAPIECGHLSSSLCHVANISYRLGSAQSPAEAQERLAGDPALSEAYGRMLEHLRANAVDLSRNSVRLGRPLAVDPAAERFLDNDPANALLSRHYRTPFVVPALT